MVGVKIGFYSYVSFLMDLIYRFIYEEVEVDDNDWVFEDVELCVNWRRMVENEVCMLL